MSSNLNSSQYGLSYASNVNNTPTVIKGKNESHTTSLIKDIIKDQPKEQNKEKDINKEIKDSMSLPEDYLYNFMDLMTNLKLISHLKEHDKLTQTEQKMEIDSRYYLQGVRRWLGGDSRDETIKYIDRIIRSADTISEKFIKSKSEDDKHNLKLLTEDLIACRNGLNNLKITYNDDKLFISTIENFIEKIKIRINKNN
jgi:hypothetical protein